MRRTIAGAVVLAALAANLTAIPGAQPRSGAASERIRLIPRDEGAALPDFVAARARFKAAIRARNVATVLAMVSDQSRFSFGDDASGPAALRRIWGLDRPGTSFWRDAEALLDEGSAVEGDCAKPGEACMVTIPYWSARFPHDRLDALEHAVVRREQALVHEEPSDKAPVVARLSYDIVRLVSASRLNETLAEQWSEVTLPGGSRGFIRRQNVYGLADIRMMFIRQPNGEWKLSAFIAGD